MRAITALFLLLAAGGALADVPADPPPASDLELDVLCDLAGPTLVTVRMHIAEDFDGGVTGIVIERSEPAVCGAPVRLDPIVFGSLAPGVHELRWNDGTAMAGTFYQYRAIPLDSGGQERAYFYPSFEMAAPVDYATCGDPPIGHGLVTSAWAPGAFEPCEGTCWSTLTVEASNPLVAPWVDSGTAVLLYGSIDCTLGNVEGCTVTVTGVVESACLSVPARPESWGALKSRY